MYTLNGPAGVHIVLCLICSSYRFSNLSV